METISLNHQKTVVVVRDRNLEIYTLYLICSIISEDVRFMGKLQRTQSMYCIFLYNVCSSFLLLQVVSELCLRLKKNHHKFSNIKCHETPFCAF
jgi:hypothetical protein